MAVTTEDVETPSAAPDVGAAAVIDRAGLQSLIEVLQAAGRTVIGPTLRDGTLVHGEIRTVDDLPRGIRDEQSGGHHRLTQRDDDALFAYAVGAHSWKQVLFPARELLWRGGRTADGFSVEADAEAPPRLALLGVRSCDLHAIALQDDVLLARLHRDAHYERRRGDVFIVAVACSHPAGTCFCTSMDTGPVPDTGFDLSLTELLDEWGHRFLVDVGTGAGRAVLASVPWTPPTQRDLAGREQVTRTAVSRIRHDLDRTDLRDLLFANAEHVQWAEVEERCLACGNCTLVCPTCFCTSVDDVTDLGGEHTERWRTWDTCFTADFSYIHGGSIRPSVGARYRHWMTHKLASWVDQFGATGCVGCGRCITWCPVGIDITEEARALRETARPRRGT
jgi:sulfhydrogenase subunit beta (sulfur reductase)